VQAQIAALRETVLNGARTDHANMIQRNMRIWQISLIGLGAGILIVIAVGRFFLRDIVIPLKTAIHHFDRIAQGDLGADIDVYGKGETGQLSRASVVMQMHLKVITDEICLVAHGIRDHCAALNAALFEIADHSEIQHDRLSEARTVLFQSEDFLNELHTLVGTLKIDLSDSEGQASLATLEKIENALRLQTFAFEDFLNRIEAIAELVVNNREDTQSAYALSEQLQQAADELYGLVAYFSPIPSSATEALLGKPLG
jgi:aerotaxis receptor